MTISEIMRYFSIRPINGCSAIRICSLIKETISKFEYSADDEITKAHVSNSTIKEFDRLNNSDFKLDKSKLRNIAVRYARMLWDKRIDLNSEVLCSHDTYLKLYQLSRPVLDYDCVIGDEFQDVNPVVADIILNQKTQRIVIGDPNQSIYGWRGAENFLKDSDEYVTLFLSKSFRYGQEIADLGMTVINYSRELHGFEERETKYG